MKKKLSILLLIYSFNIFSQSDKELTLEDIWLKGSFKAKNVYGINSMNNGLHYTTLEANDKESLIVKFDYKTGNAIDTILKSSQLKITSEKSIFIDEYQFSSDENKILIATESEQIYRHSSKAMYYVWDRKTKTVLPVSFGEKQLYATFSPNGNQVAFVRDNNLFTKDIVSGKEIQITSDGLFNKIINGASDWVYEEEFGLVEGYNWSPDGKKIAFYKFDESQVKTFNMQEYGSLYPADYRFKYPKAGEKNSIVSIWIYDLTNNKTTKADVGNEADQYIPRIIWTTDPAKLSIVRMNRYQNKLELLLTDANTGTSKIIYTEESNTYVDIHDLDGAFISFLKNKKGFIIMSEKNGFNHLYHYDLNGKLINQITKGNWDVVALKGLDEQNKLLYYTSAEQSPMNRDLYSISIEGKNKKKLSTKKGSNNAVFSANCQYYINTFSDANTPYEISLCSNNGNTIRIIESNQELKNKLKEHTISKKEFFQFSTSENITLNGWMIKPADFNPSKKYPVLMYMYGGPGINTVNDEWDGKNYVWHQLLAQKGYVVVSVDNRGTGYRGRDFKNATYKQLGKLEALDQIETAKYLSNLPYVDKTRIGVQGWSFGGYLSSLCMTKGAEYFKVGIAVAPVTNWRYYDSIYTERYLLTPQENTKGYDENSPINFADQLKGKYLLIHGTSDDNVHFQNTVEMTSALIKANKQFDLFFYPNKNHSILGGNTRYHLYTKMTNFLLENL